MLPRPPGLQAQGCDRYILDLRNNPGGLVRSSIDVAQLWMDGHAPVFNIADRTGIVQKQVCVWGGGVAEVCAVGECVWGGAHRGGCLMPVWCMHL